MFACRHPQAPLNVRLLGAFVVAYVLLPIDLIPDSIPIICDLDDVPLLAGLIWLALPMLPANVLKESRAASALLVVALWRLCQWRTWLFGKWVWLLSKVDRGQPGAR